MHNNNGNDEKRHKALASRFCCRLFAFVPLKPCGFLHMFAVPFVLQNVLSTSSAPTNKNLLLHNLLLGSLKVKILIKLYDSVSTHMDTLRLRGPEMKM